MPKRSMATPMPGTSGISRSTFFLTIVVVAVVAFALGTRGNEILATIGGQFGLNVPRGQIDLSSVQQTYRELNGRFDGKLDSQKLIDGANRGLVEAAGDRFTAYLTRQEAQKFENELSGEIGGGIGAQIGIRNKQPTIVKIIPNNPAARSNLKVGDAIVKVGDQLTKNWDSEKTAAAIRGPLNTSVTLTVQRDDKTLAVTIVRQEVNNPSVESRLEGQVGILTISRFDDETGQLAKRAAETLRQDGAKSIILDVRDNGGGYVDAAQQVASLWLDNQTVMTERQDGRQTAVITSDSAPVLDGLPTVVLINSGTASASEIVAGALQDYGKARLVGEKSFGKGSMQEIVKLTGGSELKVTIAHWFTPKGRSVKDKGLTPDKTVALTAADADAGRDPQLAAALQLLGKE